MKLSLILPTIPETKEYLRACLESIRNGRKDNTTETLVFFDGYTHDEARPILDEFKDIISYYACSPQNVGQSQAINTLSTFASGDELYLLNDDMIFLPGFDVDILSALKDTRAEKNSGIYPCTLSPKLIEPGVRTPVAPQFIKCNCGTDIENFDYGALVEKCTSLKTTSHWSFIKEHSLPLVVNRKLLLALGGWDVNYKIAPAADIDFYQKLYYFGVKSYQVQEIFVYHFSGKATRHNPNIDFNKITAQNMSLYYKKWQQN